MGTLQVGGTTLATKNSSTGKVDLHDSNVHLPAGTVIRKTYYTINRQTCSRVRFPNDNTIPQRDEGSEIFSQVYTPSTSNCNLIITAYARLAESSDNANDMTMALFISDSDDALIIGEDYTAGDGSNISSANIFIMHSMSSWGTTAKTFSLRVGDANRVNYSNSNASYANEKYGSAFKSAFVVEEIAT